jgi:hypothetical protein
MMPYIPVLDVRDVKILDCNERRSSVISIHLEVKRVSPSFDWQT